MRSPFPRRTPVPEQVAALLGKGERPLASAEAEDGTWLAGSRDALYVAPLDSAGTRLPWENIQRADWDQETATFRVERIEEFGAPLHLLSFVLDEPGPLLDLVRERVTASVVLHRRVELGRKSGFSVIGRRPPSGRGDLTWAYEFDAGVDPDDPEVMRLAEAALRDAQGDLGEPMCEVPR